MSYNLPTAHIPQSVPIPTIQLNEQDPAKVLTALDMESRTIAHLQLLYTSEVSRLEYEAEVLLELLREQDPELVEKLQLTSKIGDGLPQCSGKMYFDMYSRSAAARQGVSSSLQQPPTTLSGFSDDGSDGDDDASPVVPPPQEYQYVPHVEVIQAKKQD